MLKSKSYPHLFTSNSRKNSMRFFEKTSAESFEKPLLHSMLSSGSLENLNSGLRSFEKPQLQSLMLFYKIGFSSELSFLQKTSIRFFPKSLFYGTALWCLSQGIEIEHLMIKFWWTTHGSILKCCHLDFRIVDPPLTVPHEVSASRAWYQHCRKWPFLGGVCEPRTSIFGNVDVTL